MNRLFSSLYFILFAVFFLSSCSEKVSNKTFKTEIKPEAPLCKYPYTSDSAPAWLCGENADGYYKTAVGQVEVNKKAGIDYELFMAQKNAKSNLDNKIKQNVTNVAIVYLSSYGVNKEVLRSAVYSIISNIDSNNAEKTPVLIDVRKSPNGEVFVLLGIDKKQNFDIVKSAVKKAIRYNQALWEEFSEDGNFDDIVTSIARIS